MFFNDDRLASQFFDFRIGQAEHLAFSRVHLDCFDAFTRCILVIDHFDQLRAA